MELQRLSEGMGMVGERGMKKVKGVAAKEVMAQFAEAVRRLISEVREQETRATVLKEKLLTGASVELHEVLLAVEKTHLAFRTLIAVRNRLLEAFQELMRMPV